MITNMLKIDYNPLVVHNEIKAKSAYNINKKYRWMESDQRQNDTVAAAFLTLSSQSPDGRTYLIWSRLHAA